MGRFACTCIQDGWNWHAWLCPNAGSIYAFNNHVSWLSPEELQEAIYFLERGGLMFRSRAHNGRVRWDTVASGSRGQWSLSTSPLLSSESLMT